MFHADLADTPLASYRPDFAQEIDTFSDRLREALAPFVPVLQQPRAFAALQVVIDAEELELGASEPVREQLGFEFLRRIYHDTRLPAEQRLEAAAKAIAAEDPTFPESYEYYANAFGVTRACLHGRARVFQRLTGLRARRDKQDSAREKSRANASGVKRVVSSQLSVVRPAKTCGVQHKTLRSLFSFFPGL